MLQVQDVTSILFSAIEPEIEENTEDKETTHSKIVRRLYSQANCKNAPWLYPLLFLSDMQGYNVLN